MTKTTFSARPTTLITKTNMAFDNTNTAGQAECPVPAKRRQNRIAAMQFLYAWEATKSHRDLGDELYAFFSVPEAFAGKEREGDTESEPSFADVDSLGNSREYYAFAEELAAGTLQNLARIDGVISDATQNWELSRMARCDLAILRLAVYELLYRTDIPPIVTINEAIDLAKIYSTDDSHRFVNGVLDRIKKHLSRPLRTAQ